MSSNKRPTKSVPRPRKKPPMNHIRLPNQLSSSGDLGIYNNAHFTYHYARCFMGNIVELFTSSQKFVGVVKAIGPDGSFGLKHVRISQRGSDDGPYELYEDKIVPLSDIKKVTAHNVNLTEVLKGSLDLRSFIDIEDTVADVENGHMDDPETCLQQYFQPHEVAESCTLVSDEQFPPEMMFEVNKQKYNVISSYQESLEGYTVPLDKNDPQYKAKEEFYSKLASEIEGEECMADLWETMADEDLESEEMKFSAVKRVSDKLREAKNAFARGGKRGTRGANRSSLPRETFDASKSLDPKQTKSGSSTLLRDKSSGEKVATGSLPSEACDKVLMTTDANISAQTENETHLSSSEQEKSLPSEHVDKEDAAKEAVWDLDAPEFKPSKFIQPLESANTSSSAPTPAPQLQSAPITGPNLPGQSLNGGTNVPQLAMSVSAGYMFTHPMATQFASIRPQVALTPHQYAAMSQHLSSVALTSPPNVQTTAAIKVPRHNVGTFSKQRSMDQSSTASQLMQLSLHPNLVQPGSYPFGVPLISPVTGNFHTSAFPGMFAMSGTASTTAASCQQQPAASPTDSQAGQVSHTQQNPQSHVPSSQAQSSQLSSGFNSQLSTAHCLPGYPQYQPGQVIGPQVPPGSIGYFSPQIYQAPGLIPFPMPPVGSANHAQVNTQLNSQASQQFIPTPTLQPQAGQQSGSVQSFQQTPQILFSPCQQVLAQSMAMGVTPQTVQNAFTLPPNVHPQAHQMQFFVQQPPNGTA